MTDAKQTKCPHCGSTFRITDAQLAAKGGSVRCGSCLQVFRADLHLVGAAPAARPAAPAAPAAAKPAAAKPKPAKGDESWALDLIGEEGGKGEDWKMPEEAGGADSFGFSDDDINAFIAKGEAPPEAAAPGKSILFDDELSDQLDEVGDNFLTPTPETHRLSENADESWAKDILTELETEEKKGVPDQYGMEIVDSKKGKPKNPKLAAAVGLAPPVPEAAPAAKAPAKPAKPAAPVDDFLGEDADVLSFLDDDDLSQPGAAAPAPVPAANPFALERPLAHVDAPVTLKPQRDPIRWGYVLGWGFMCLVALVLLVVQYVFFNFDSLATNPSLRPTFEKACARIGCYLPDIPDPSRLKVEDLVVRKHPDIEGALVVDAILKNHASFPQPFPVLRLRFSNAADEVVASRLLKPAEYLQGEARVLRRMPPDTPIRISLEIVDPGKEAISYGLDPIL